MSNHQFYSWRGVPVEIEWFDGPVDVTNITMPAEHPTGMVPYGERHALVHLLFSKRNGWWASEDAVIKHAERIGPARGSNAVGLE